MLELSLKTASGDISTFKKIVSDGISGERKKIRQQGSGAFLFFCPAVLWGMDLNISLCDAL